MYRNENKRSSGKNGDKSLIVLENSINTGKKSSTTLYIESAKLGTQTFLYNFSSKIHTISFVSLFNAFVSRRKWSGQSFNFFSP